MRLLTTLLAGTTATALTYTQLKFTQAPLGAISTFGNLTFSSWLVTNVKSSGGLTPASPPKMLIKTDFAAYIDPPSSAIALYLDSFWMGCSNSIPGDYSGFFPLGCTVDIVAEGPDFKYDIVTSSLLFQPTNISNPAWMKKFTGPFVGSRLYFVVTGGTTGTNLFIDNLNFTSQ